MDLEVGLAEAVRDWARAYCPQRPSVAERAAAVALECYVGGASVAEASEQARRYVRGWVCHPSNSGYLTDSSLPLAS